MNTDRLRFDLADLAAEVTPVDLRDRALRTSRRLGLVRAIATSAAAVVMIGAATGTAFALRPRTDGPGPMPADTPSITFSPAPVEPSPTPPASTAAPTTSTTGPVVLAGTRYYLGLTAENAVIHAVRGDTTEVVASIPLGSICVRNSITVSPDGRRLAWVRGGDTSGELMTAGIDGSGQRALAAAVNCFGSTPLVWQGGDLLMVQQRNGASRLMDMKAGKPFEGDFGQETDRCWSADGRYLAALAEPGKPYVTGPGVTRMYRYTPPAGEAANYDGWSARSVSMNGRYVSVGWKGTDPSRQDGSFAVVDTTTSKVLDLPVEGEIRSIHFTADRKVLVRQADRIVVLDSKFDVLGEVAEPRDIRNLPLLAYVP